MVRRNAPGTYHRAVDRLLTGGVPPARPRTEGEPVETQSWQFLAKIGGIPPRAWSAIAPRGRVHPGVVDRLSDAVAADARALAPHESVVGARLLQVLVSTARTRGRGADAEAGHVDSGGPRKDAKAALSDLFWALLNSSEFSLNH